MRRLFVFGALSLLVVAALRLLASQVSPGPLSASLAPTPIPVATPKFDCTANTPLPQDFVSTWTLEYGATNFNLTVIDLAQDCTYSLGDVAAVFPTASTGKVMVAAGVLEQVADGTMEFSKIENDLIQMITQSDNNAADRLFVLIGGNKAIDTIATRYGLASTTTGGAWGTILTSSADQASLLNQVLGTQPSALPEAQRVILRNMMSSVNPEQAWGAGHMKIANWSAAVKNGWYLSVPGDRAPVGLWRINSLGYVWDEANQPRWIFTGYSNSWNSEAAGISAWNAVSQQLSNSLGIR